MSEKDFLFEAGDISIEKLPPLIVFDLDFTLWDCGGTWCDCLCPPFQKRERVNDSQGHQIELYKDVESILDWCDSQQVHTALASRTEQPTWARELLSLLGIAERFRWQEIYPSSKLRHFSAIKKSSGIDFTDMLFFDDEMRNIRELSSIVVASFFVEAGLSHGVFKAGLQLFEASRKVG